LLLARLSSPLKNDGALLFEIFFLSTVTEQLLAFQVPSMRRPAPVKSFLLFP
jgi:hypothetical protein